MADPEGARDRGEGNHHVSAVSARPESTPVPAVPAAAVSAATVVPAATARSAGGAGFVDYPTNTVLTNLSADVSDLVEDDLFQANVQVLGSLSYDTQLGGETTVPNLSVISLKIIGSVK